MKPTVYHIHSQKEFEEVVSIAEDTIVSAKITDDSFYAKRYPHILEKNDNNEYHIRRDSKILDRQQSPVSVFSLQVWRYMPKGMNRMNEQAINDLVLTMCKDNNISVVNTMIASPLVLRGYPFWYGCYDDWENSIYINGPKGMRAATVTHETAHALAPRRYTVEDHGKEFMRIYFDLLMRYCECKIDDLIKLAQNCCVRVEEYNEKSYYPNIVYIQGIS